ncbi:hypothetical protein ElyMa_004060400 [Elysia marginata]|uniref:Uncharacterized protein n=1 Tax=Elysia marginata TaxID=1093978 RepID=A0AAV4G797_9GAST|nr:hypothetical protein ElyMa_004060400 [Elysia marginata]
MVYDHLIVDGARLCWDPSTGTVRAPFQTQHQVSDRAPRGALDAGMKTPIDFCR